MNLNINDAYLNRPDFSYARTSSRVRTGLSFVQPNTFIGVKLSPGGSLHSVIWTLRPICIGDSSSFCQKSLACPLGGGECTHVPVDEHLDLGAQFICEYIECVVI